MTEPARYEEAWGYVPERLAKALEREGPLYDMPSMHFRLAIEALGRARDNWLDGLYGEQCEENLCEAAERIIGMIRGMYAERLWREGGE